jgi:hypothetical protein
MKTILGVAGMAAVLLLAGCGLERRVPVEMVTIDQSRPIGSESSLRAQIRFDIGALEISGATAPDLYSLNLEYDKAGYNPEINYEPGSEGFFNFRLQSAHEVGIRSQRQSNRLRLALTDAIPVNLQINTGVGDARLALSRLRLSRLDLEAGVGGARISTYDPNPVICEEVRLRNGVGSLDAVGLGNLNFRRLEFDGGVGGANLDFSGAWKQDADVRLQIGVGGVTVRMPRDVGVRVTAERHFLSGMQLDGFRREGGEDYYSEKYSEKKVRITIDVKTGIGGFRITWI